MASGDVRRRVARMRGVRWCDSGRRRRQRGGRRIKRCRTMQLCMLRIGLLLQKLLKLRLQLQRLMLLRWCSKQLRAGLMRRQVRRVRLCLWLRLRRKRLGLRQGVYLCSGSRTGANACAGSQAVVGVVTEPMRVARARAASRCLAECVCWVLLRTLLAQLGARLVKVGVLRLLLLLLLLLLRLRIHL